LGKPGDRLVIMSYTWVDEALARDWRPRVIVLGEGNQVLEQDEPRAGTTD
jgi:aspartate 1-decarboxylase